ncbi:flagellar hook-basal body complex protein FliE [Psychromonas sp.]|nr:flagellar hook-basal body complex protein FliE [Psychromonas sp.]
MNINAASMFNELQTQGLQAKGLDSDSSVKSTNSTSTDFSAMLKQAIENVNGLQQETSTLRNSFEMGDQDVSLADVMIASNKSGLAFDATVQVRNKMVEAYKEVMSMPV